MTNNPAFGVYGFASIGQRGGIAGFLDSVAGREVKLGKG